MRPLLCLVVVLSASAVPSHAKLYGIDYLTFRSGASDVSFYVSSSLDDRADYDAIPYYETNFGTLDGPPDVDGFLDFEGGPYDGGPLVGPAYFRESFFIVGPGVNGRDTSGYLGAFPGTISTVGVLNILNFVPGVYNYVGASTGIPATLTISDEAPTPVAETPEPSTLTLLGTGVLGLLGTLKRRSRWGHQLN